MGVLLFDTACCFFLFAVAFAVPFIGGRFK